MSGMLGSFGVYKTLIDCISTFYKKLVLAWLIEDDKERNQSDILLIIHSVIYLKIVKTWL